MPEWGIIIQYIVWNAFALQSYLSNFKTICFQERHFRRFLWNKDETIGKTWQEITKQDHKRKKLFQLPVSPKFLPIIWWAKIGSIMYIMSVIMQLQFWINYNLAFSGDFRLVESIKYLQCGCAFKRNMYIYKRTQHFFALKLLIDFFFQFYFSKPNFPQKMQQKILAE